MIIRDTTINKLETFREKINKVFDKNYDYCIDTRDMINNNEKYEFFNKEIEFRISKVSSSQFS